MAVAKRRPRGCRGGTGRARRLRQHMSVERRGTPLRPYVEGASGQALARAGAARGRR